MFDVIQTYSTLLIALLTSVAVFLIVARFLLKPREVLSPEALLQMRIQQRRDNEYQETRRERTQRMLAQAGFGESVTPGRFYLFTVGSGIVLAAAAQVTLQYVVVTVAAFLFGMFLPYYYASTLMKRRRRELNLEVQKFAQFAANNLRSGEPITEIFARVANKKQGRMATEMAVVMSDIAHNVPKQKALNDAAARVGNRFFNIIVMTLNNIGSSDGGKVAANLENQVLVIAQHITDTNDELATLSMTRGTYKMMVGLIIGFLLFMKTAYPQLIDLFYGSAIGQIFFILIGGWIFLGYWLQGREFEEPE